MIESALRRSAVLVASLGTASFALAQGPAIIGEPAGPAPPWAFVAAMSAIGMLFVLGIIAAVFFNETRKNRDRLALIERLVTSGQPVPRELMAPGPLQLTLRDERRLDIRRGITLLAWAIAVALIPVIGSGGEWRYAVWGLLFFLPSLGSFLKAHLTAREMARRDPNGSPQL